MRLAETLLKGLVMLRERSGANDDPILSGDWATYITWQFDTSATLFGKFPGFDWKGKSVLEIGCGTGGRAAFLASTGAARVVGIDINAQEIEIARRHVPELYPATAGRLEYHVSPESATLDIGVFDVVLVVDTLEHLVSPPQMLRLCHDYTAPGGRCWMSGIGWYHWHGSHHTELGPFANLFFSDETILNVIRWRVSRPGYVPGRFDSEPPVDRWRGIYDLRHRPGEYLNKLTLREMKRLARHSIFPQTRLHVVGFANPRLRVLNPLRHVPIVQEVVHSFVVMEFSR